MRLLSARGIVSKEISASDIVEAAEKTGISKDKLAKLIARNKIKICAKSKCSEHLNHPHFERVGKPKDRGNSSYTSRITNLKKLTSTRKSRRQVLSPNWLSRMVAESKHTKRYNPNKTGRENPEFLDVVEAEKRMESTDDGQGFDPRTGRYADAIGDWKFDIEKNRYKANPRILTNYSNKMWSSEPIEPPKYNWEKRGTWAARRGVIYWVSPVNQKPWTCNHGLQKVGKYF